MDKAEYVFTKLAQEDTRPEAGYWAEQMAMSRALRRGNTGSDKLVAKGELIEQRVPSILIGGALGTLVGAGAGAGLGYAIAKQKGALYGGNIGSIVGLPFGATLGAYRVDKEYLKPKGITMSNLGFSYDLSEEAKRKYLSDKYRGGGYNVEMATNG